MEPGTNLDLNSSVSEADNLERRLYRTWPFFHIYVFGQIIKEIQQIQHDFYYANRDLALFPKKQTIFRLIESNIQ